MSGSESRKGRVPLLASFRIAFLSEKIAGKKIRWTGTSTPTDEGSRNPIESLTRLRRRFWGQACGHNNSQKRGHAHGDSRSPGWRSLFFAKTSPGIHNALAFNAAA